MEVILAEHAGFCWGVKRAIEMATEAREKAGTDVYVLGHLVHNEEVVRDLESNGINVVEDMDQVPPGSVLLITAHGLDYKIIQQATDRGFQVIDTTCPIVQNVHKFTRRFLDEGREIVIIGHSDHIEVKGISGVTDGRAQIVGDISELGQLRIAPDAHVGVVAQTTFNQNEMHQLVEALEQRSPDILFKVKDSICYDVKDKQHEIRELARKVDAVVVVGSRTSSNTNRLFEIASEICGRTLFVSKVDELDPESFQGVASVCVTAGASTPDWIIEKVVAFLRDLDGTK